MGLGCAFLPSPEVHDRAFPAHSLSATPPSAPGLQRNRQQNEDARPWVLPPISAPGADYSVTPYGIEHCFQVVRNRPADGSAYHAREFRLLCLVACGGSVAATTVRKTGRPRTQTDSWSSHRTAKARIDLRPALLGIAAPAAPCP
jgi:hypothetical protein